MHLPLAVGLAAAKGDSMKTSVVRCTIGCAVPGCTSTAPSFFAWQGPTPSNRDLPVHSVGIPVGWEVGMVSTASENETPGTYPPAAVQLFCPTHRHPDTPPPTEVPP